MARVESPAGGSPRKGTAVSQGFNDTPATLPLLPRLRAALLPHIEAGFPTVAAFQSACGVVGGKPTNWLAHGVLTLGAALGNEMMFILFLPFLFWDFDVTVARRLIMVWGFTYYVGQGLKDMCVRPGCAVVVDGCSNFQVFHVPTSVNALVLPTTFARCLFGFYVIL